MTTRHRYEHANYLRRAMNVGERKKAMRRAVAALRGAVKQGVFSAIAVQGVSGLTFGAILADKLDVPLMVIRKAGVYKHSSRLVEGCAQWDVHDVPVRYLFVDDLIDTGTTFEHVLHAIPRAICAGWWLYDDENRRQSPLTLFIPGNTLQDACEILDITPPTLD